MTDRTPSSSRSGGPPPRTEGPAPADPRLRGLFQALPRRRAPGEECPQPAELWASARGEVGAERQRWLIGHTGRCPSCAEDWRLARHLERGEAVTSSTGAAGGHSGSSSWRLRRFALAATVILAVAVAALWWAQTGLERRPPADRSLEGPKIEPLTPEDQPLSRDNPVLEWRGPEGVEDVRYDVLVMTARKLDVIAHAERLERTEFTLPAEAIAALPSGTELRWKVEATLPDGSRERSDSYRIRLE